MNMQICVRKNENLRTALMIGGFILLIIIGLTLFCPSVFADEAATVAAEGGSGGGGNDPAGIMISSVVRVITTLCTVVGIILGIVGFVKFIIAHANEQGPDQQKAIMWIAVAIILVIVPNVISAIAGDWTSLINTGEG